jgi:hypothetical protein
VNKENFIITSFIFFYHSPNIIRVMKNGKCGSYREKINAYRVLVGKPEGRRSLARSLVLDVRKILEWFLMKYDGSVWTRLT